MDYLYSGLCPYSLEDLVTRILKKDQLVFMGDLNARVSRDEKAWLEWGHREAG